MSNNVLFLEILVAVMFLKQRKNRYMWGVGLNNNVLFVWDIVSLL